MIISELLNQAGQWILSNPVEFLSYTVTGATVTFRILTDVLPGAKWDNKAYRFLQKLSAVISFDTEGKKVVIDFKDKYSEKEGYR